jgi:hypothetical protein
MTKSVYLNLGRLLGILAMTWLAPAATSAAANCTTQQGQTFIDAGRIEAELLAGKFSNAVRDYAATTAFVLPVHPDAESTIVAGYSARLTISPNNLTALIGLSFARWRFFEYSAAIQLTDQILILRPGYVVREREYR